MHDSDPNVHLVPDKRPQLSFASEDPGALFEVQLPISDFFNCKDFCQTATSWGKGSLGDSLHAYGCLRPSLCLLLGKELVEGGPVSWSRYPRDGMGTHVTHITSRVITVRGTLPTRPPARPELVPCSVRETELGEVETLA